MADHLINERGTVDCPVVHVRAFVDDGECSACGALCEEGDTDG